MKKTTLLQQQKLEKTLRNIGPVCAKQLLSVGIDTPEKLKKIGATEAYLRIIQHPAYKSEYHAAYLYALEGAIQDCDWRAIPEEKKEEYKRIAASLRQTKKKKPILS